MSNNKKVDLKEKRLNDNKGLVNQKDCIVNLEPIREKELAHMKEEQELQHLANICRYLAYTDKAVLDETMGVVISSINTEGDDWFYYVEDSKTEEMVTYWCYCDEISGDKTSLRYVQEVCGNT